MKPKNKDLRSRLSQILTILLSISALSCFWVENYDDYIPGINDQSIEHKLTQIENHVDAHISEHKISRNVQGLIDSVIKEPELATGPNRQPINTKHLNPQAGLSQSHQPTHLKKKYRKKTHKRIQPRQYQDRSNLIRKQVHSFDSSFWIFFNSFFYSKELSQFYQRFKHHFSVSLEEINTLRRIFERKSLRFQTAGIRALINPDYNFDDYILWLFSRKEMRLFFTKFLISRNYGGFFLQTFCRKYADLDMVGRIKVISQKKKIEYFWYYFWKMCHGIWRGRKRVKWLIAKLKHPKGIRERAAVKLGGEKEVQQSKSKTANQETKKVEKTFNNFKKKKSKGIKSKYYKKNETRETSKVTGFKLIRKERLKKTEKPNDLSNVKIGQTRFLDVFKDKINSLKRKK